MLYEVLRLELRGPRYFIDEQAQTFSPVDIMERGQIGRLGLHVPLSDYAPLGPGIADASLDLVTCYVGLHHMSAERLGYFLQSVRRVLRPGGAFIVRDHDVRSDELRALVSLAHTVFNAGLGESWETNLAELRYFESAKTWVDRLQAQGFDDTGHRVLQDNDPTDNTLFCFVRRLDPQTLRDPAVMVQARGVRP